MKINTVLVMSILGIGFNLFLFGLVWNVILVSIPYLVICGIIISHKAQKMRKKMKEYNQWLQNIEAGKKVHD